MTSTAAPVVAQLLLIAEEIRDLKNHSAFTADVVRELARDIRGGGQKVIVATVACLTELATVAGDRFAAMGALLRKAAALVGSLVVRKAPSVSRLYSRLDSDDDRMLSPGATWPNYYPSRV